MSDKSKDGLEDFFRKGAQKYDLEFREEDWRKLESMLDRVDNGVFVPWYHSVRWWLPAVLMLFVSAAGIWWFLLKENTIIADQAKMSAKKEMKLEDRIGQIMHGLGYPLPNESKNNEYKIDHSDKPFPEDEVATTGVPEDLHQAESELNNRRFENPDALTVGIGISENSANEHAPIISTLLVFGSTPLSGSAKLTRKEWNYVSPLSAIFIDDYEIFGTPSKEIRAPQKAEDLSFQILEDRRDIPIYHPYLGISLAFSPDFSGVELGEIGERGRRIGIIVDYSLSRRFSLNTGAIWTNNKYEAYGSEYGPPTGFWTYGVVPDETLAECKILDIPVNLRYNVGLWHRHMLFLSAGISSYIMLEEHYYYEYEEDDPDLVHYWGEENSGEHIFGIANLSFGYEFLIQNNLSFQVEPFIKVPLTGIGHGNVALKSLGSYFSIKYRMTR